MRASVAGLILALAACSSGQGNSPANAALNDSEPNNGIVENAANAAKWPSSLNPFGDGYPSAGDACRRVGESAATSDYLDDSADLVGCPTADAAKALRGKVVGTVDGITLVSVSRGNANAGMASAKPRDIIRGKGGLEEKCLAKVAEITRAPVIGVNRIDETKNPIQIFVNVQGAQAPWRCEARRDGTLGAVEYSESEGDL